MGFDRRAFIVAAACLPAFSLARADGPGDAVAVVKSLQDGMLDTIRNAAKTTPRARFERLRPAIGAAFDLAYMARLAYGAGWDGLSEAQRGDWTNAFGDYVAASYAARLDSLNATGFERDDTVAARGEEVVVTARMTITDGKPLPIDYVMRRAPQGWRIGDILANGSVSELAQWRRSLRGLGAEILRQRRDALLTP